MACLCGLCGGSRPRGFEVAEGSLGIEESLAVPPSLSEVNGGVEAARSGAVSVVLLLPVLDGLPVMLECTIGVPRNTIDAAQLMMDHAQNSDILGREQLECLLVGVCRSLEAASFPRSASVKACSKP